MLLLQQRQVAPWLDCLVAGWGLKLIVLGCGEAERPKRSRDLWVGGIERRMNSAKRETGKRATESWIRTQRREEQEGVLRATVPMPRRVPWRTP
jgi:hypothetical protein